MRGFADDSTDGPSAAAADGAEALGSPGMPMEASSFSSQASYLEAVSSAIVAMPPDALRQSLEYVLPPVVRVLRAETEALGRSGDADTPSDTPSEPLKRRAARLEALESAARCVSRVVRRAGRCGNSPDASLELFAALVSTLGRAVEASDGSATRSTTTPANENADANAQSFFAQSSSGALEHVRLAALDATRGALSVFADADVTALVEKDANLPVLGYAVSLFLNVARAEAARGALGSRVLRREALAALAELVAAAARGEALLASKKQNRNTSRALALPSALAFFLPGVVSGCARAVAASVGSRAGHGAGPASAAEDGAAAEAAAAALSTVCRAALADADFVLRTRRVPPDGPNGPSSQSISASADAAAAERAALAAELRGLAKRPAKDVHGASRRRVAEDASSTRPEEAEEEAEDHPGFETTLDSNASPEIECRLRVVRDSKWLAAAAPRVAAAASSAYAQLVTHAKPSARAAAARGALEVLETCGETLGETACVALLSAALVAARDPWRSASDGARANLERLFGTRKGEKAEKNSEKASFHRALLIRAFRESLRALPRAARRESQSFDATDEGGGGGEGGACARRAAAALDLLDADALAETLLTDDGARRDVSAALAACFEMEPDVGHGVRGTSRDLSRSTSRSGTGTNASFDVDRDARERSARWLVFFAGNGGVPDEEGEPRAKNALQKNTTLVPSPVPPPRASFLSHSGLFAAVAGVARALGANPAILPALLETHLRLVRETLAGARDAEEEEARESTRLQSQKGMTAFSAADAWRRKARAHVAVAVELLLGSAEGRAAEDPGSSQAASTRISTARNALEAFLAGGAWDLPTSPAAAAAAAARRRRERKRERRSARWVRKAKTRGVHSAPRGDRERGEADARSDSGEDEASGSDSDSESGSDAESFGDDGRTKPRVANVRFAATARENALLACLLLEAVGSVACACGPTFVKNGGFLPTALVPLLLKLGDENARARETAEGVLFRVAVVGGFFTGPVSGVSTSNDATEKITATSADVSAAIGALVTENADYVVDALSRRLRRLEAFPDAARFFAAVLGSGTKAGGAARRLLPFLRDPIARAAEAISVKARAVRFTRFQTDDAPRDVGHDDDVCAFTRIMAQTASAASAEARATDDEIAEASVALAPLTRALAKREEAKRTGLVRRDGEMSAFFSGHLENDDDTIDETSRTQSQNESFEDLSKTDVASLTRSLPPLLASWRRRQTRLARTSKLCAVMARAAAPLMESGDPRRRRLASAALAASLRACGAFAASFARDEPVRAALRGAFPEDVPEDDSFNPEDRVVKVLPLIHETWPHVAVALVGQPRGPSVSPSAFEASADALAACAEASQPGNGGFVSRRLLRDAWPGLVRVLKLGAPSIEARRDQTRARLERVALIDGKTMTASYAFGDSFVTSAGASDGGHRSLALSERIERDGGVEDRSDRSDRSAETPASRATTRASAVVRTCVLRLLETLASDEATKEATRDVASFALAAAVPFALGEPTTRRNVTGGTGTSDRLARELTTRAVAAVTALAAIDPDAAWMALASRATGRDDVPVPEAPRFVIPSDGETPRKRHGSEFPRLPSFREISPAPKTQTSPSVAAAAARLLAAIEGRAETGVESG